MSNSTLQIKNNITIESLPSQCDFILPGHNTLLYSKSSHFKKDFIKLSNEFGFSSIQLNLKKILEDESIESPWARDFITCKTPYEIYILRDDIQSIKNQDQAIIAYNLNISSSIISNSECFFKFSSNENFQCKPTNIISAGGNIFHCVNAEGKPYAIVGEVGLTSQIDIKYPLNFIKSFVTNTKTVRNSINKYSFPTNWSNEKCLIYIRKRMLNKKILKSQLDTDTNLVIVPNSFMWHIDVEMAALPNGVILLHSFKNTLQLLVENKDEISNYDDLYKRTEELSEQTHKLFAITKSKLEKRNFIVKEICGFVGEMNNNDRYNDKKIIACGLNSVVGVTKEGEIFYTLCNDNPNWYKEYFIQELKKCGISKIIFHSNSLDILTDYFGSIRCQYNTVANGFLTLNKIMQHYEIDFEQAQSLKREKMGGLVLLLQVNQVSVRHIDFVFPFHIYLNIASFVMGLSHSNTLKLFEAVHKKLFFESKRMINKERKSNYTLGIFAEEQYKIAQTRYHNRIPAGRQNKNIM